MPYTQKEADRLGVTLPALVHGTHLEALANCLGRTTGRVLELGCGPRSTPFLHARCRRRPRLLYSLDDNLTWMQEMERRFKRNWHHFVRVDDWAANPLLDAPWDVALVDNAPREARAPAVRRLADRVQFIVVHDTECARYGFEDILPKFRYRRDYRRALPWATVVSNFKQP